MADWDKIEGVLAGEKTIALLVEDIPKHDGVETKISVIHPEDLEGLLDDAVDIYELYDAIGEYFTLTTEIHLTSLKSIQVYHALR